ncbi:hypothetical protein [Shimia sp. SDUM112013]|uniref:hypothetical protein n=1 Tax=Shimia sp. SDUM112013 TaxID=3136160 RepID=UPI0032EFDE6E
MREIHINEPELQSIDLFRAALSEETSEQRRQAIAFVKQDIVAGRLDALASKHGENCFSDPTNVEFVQWIARTASARHEAAIGLMQIGRRYDEKNGNKLSVAEHIGMQVWLSIRQGKFEGVYTDTGVLQQVRDDAKETKVRGARDKDILRKIWRCYRGVVHLGMAIEYCEENPDQGMNVIGLSEILRRDLCENCPKGTSNPYVDPSEQFSFVYLSYIWGPRFQNRGLSFDTR